VRVVGNSSPTVAITSPTAGAGFQAPAQITVTANAADSDGQVAKVDFYAGSTLLGSDSTSPYSFNWNGAPAGSYRLTARAIDDLGAATTSSPVDITVTIPPGSGGTGLTGSYFNSMNPTGLVLSRTDPTVNFDWGQGRPAAGVGPDNFSVRWTGQVLPQYSETYRFYTVSDDGVRLWVNGQLLINNWTDHPSTEHSGTIALTAGQNYDIKMEYYDHTQDAVAKLLWSRAQPRPNNQSRKASYSIVEFPSRPVSKARPERPSAPRDDVHLGLAALNHRTAQLCASRATTRRRDHTGITRGAAEHPYGGDRSRFGGSKLDLAEAVAPCPVRGLEPHWDGSIYNR
jgi:hypothetical protein